MTPDDAEILERETRYAGYFRLESYRYRHKLFGGGWCPPISREIFERGHAVAIILYDPDLDLLVLIEQFRVGALAAMQSPWFDSGFSPWLIEIVAGIIDAGETPERVAIREAMEEAGCEVTELMPVQRFLTSPGGSSESIMLYCGRIDASNTGGIHGLDDENEDIRVFTARPAEVFAWLDAGRFINAATVIGLQWFRHNHERVRTLWRPA